MSTDPFAVLPELTDAGQLIRIASEQDVMITRRVRAVIDTPAFQRLKRISQLGLVSHVYPGAVHSRFEHCLGVYRLALVVLSHLRNSQPEVIGELSADQIKVFLLAALLHDVGHWPFCHPIEDMRLPNVPRHEALARQLICEGELQEVIEQQWQVSAQSVADFIAGPVASPGALALQNVLNGPVDIDKMDYLQRDSLHAGVPYGRNFDTARLISSLRIGLDQSSMAITEKGKTAAEMLVFARYVMFSEVYWHHAVRSATAMLQRLVFCVLGDSSEGQAESWLLLSDDEFARAMLDHADDVWRPLAEGLFSNHRQLYKRFSQYNFAENAQLHQALARRPYEQLVSCSRLLAERLSRRLARPLADHDVLIDAPPVKLEVQFKLPVLCRSPDTEGVYRSVPLADISPVVRSLATDQFDNFVKKVRVFINPTRRAELNISTPELTDLLLEVTDSLG
ncbi:MAG: HD domain-containing protein [Pirellulaceae bacterium]